MLEKINNLEDFKKIDTKDYPKLASEIREFLIDKHPVHPSEYSMPRF